jgi:hypothetical protein
MALEKIAKQAVKKVAKKKILPPYLLERTKAASIVEAYVKERLTNIGSTVPAISELNLKPAKMKGLWSFKGKATRQAFVNGRVLGGQILEFKGMVNTLSETVTNFGSKVIGNLRKF